MKNTKFIQIIIINVTNVIKNILYKEDKMNIKVTKNIEEANCITHNGTFHCDEIFSTIMFSKLLPEVVVCRTSDLEKSREKQYIYDVGGGELDHQ